MNTDTSWKDRTNPEEISDYLSELALKLALEGRYDDADKLLDAYAAMQEYADSLQRSIPHATIPVRGMDIRPQEDQ